MKRAEIKILTSEIFAEMNTRCTLAANAAQNLSQGECDVHDTRDIVDDGNRETILGIIARLAFECMNILYPFAKTPIKSVYHDNSVQDVEAYVIVLDFDRERSETQVLYLDRLIHDYIVYKAFSEWLATTMPDSQWQVWEQKALDARKDITQVLSIPYRTKRVRITPHFY